MKIAASFLAFVCIAISAVCQQSLLPLMSSTRLATATNYPSISNGIIGWNIDQVGVFQSTLTATNPVTTNCQVIFYLETSDNGTDWKTNSYQIVSSVNSTNAVTTLTRVTNTIGGKWLRVGSYNSTNVYPVDVNRFTVSFK